jgi:sugar phosphate isomerase/epimerase
MVKCLRSTEVILPLSRRDLLILLPAFALADGSPEPHIQFPSKPRDRLAVTSWPFRTYIESPTNRGRKASVPGMDLKNFPAFVVEKFGLHNINPLADHFSSTDDAYLAGFRAAVEKADSHLVDLGLAGRYFYDPDATTRQSAVDYGRKWIDIAVKIGSPSVRQHLQVRRGHKPDPATGAEGLRQLAEYGAKRNIVINLENDNATAEDPFLLVAMIEKVNSPYLRALPDFGNSLIGHDEEYNERGVEAMLGHAWNMCHVKDSVEGEDGQMKKVDLARMFGLAKQSSYRGYYSMEFDTDAGDPIAGTQNLVQESLQYLR